MNNLTPKQQARKRQDKKRAGLPRVSPFFISEDEAIMLDELAEKYGSRKAAIIAGLRILHQKALV